MKAIKLPFKFDHKKLEEELATIKSSFTPSYSTKVKKHDLDGFHLITSAKDRSGGTSYCYTQELEKCPYLKSVLETFQSDKFLYRVHVLHPKGKIASHSDTGKGLVNRVVRLQIPVKTNHEVYFLLNKERILMQNGECWLVDITQPHEVENQSDEDRIKLLIDCDLNSWWEDILKAHDVHLEHYTGWNRYSLEELSLMKTNLLQLKTNIDDQLMQTIEMEIQKRNAHS